METLQPKLRFPEFKGNWEIVKLDNFTKSISSGKSKSRDIEGKYCLYGSTGTIGYTDVNDYEGKCILIARVGANAGNLYKVDGNYSVTDNTLMLYTNEDSFFDFTYFLLKTVELNKLVFGSGQPLITGGQLKNLNLYVPKIKEQTRIANFLSAVDEKLQLLKEKKALLDEYKKGMMQKIFNQELRFKDENGEDFGDWEEKMLNDFMTERNTQLPKSEKYPLMSFVANKGVTHKGDRYNREFLVSDEGNKKYKQTEYGDFIYSSNNLETGSIGLNNYGLASISPVYSIFKINELCDFQFISSYLSRKEFISKMTTFRQGVVYGQWRIHEKNFLQIKERLPSIEEQAKIAKFLSAIDEKIGLVGNQIEETVAYKKGLLQQMFI